MDGSSSGVRRVCAAAWPCLATSSCWSHGCTEQRQMESSACRNASTSTNSSTSSNGGWEKRGGEVREREGVGIEGIEGAERQQPFLQDEPV